jgi:hypothetical protein
MSPRSKRPDDDDDLLDLPFDAPSEEGPRSGDDAEDEGPGSEEPTNLALFDSDATEEEAPMPSSGELEVETQPVAAREDVEATGVEEDDVTAVSRWLAGSVDVLIHGGVLAALLLLLYFGFGVEPRSRQWPGYLLFLLSFSFLYVTLPLAFWGQTPGMAWLRLQTRDHDDRPMTFGQTVVQWAVGLGTTVLLGLPLLLTSGQRSLADRLTGAVTHRFPAGP